MKKMLPCLRFGLLLCCVGLLAWLAAGCATTTPAKAPLVPKWERYERSFTSIIDYANPIQDAELRVVFTSPTGENFAVYGFWDGGKTWKVRFSPNQVGTWSYRTTASNKDDLGLHDHGGKFVCTAPFKRTVFEKHGPVQVSRDGHHLAHEDGTPFFWMADTGWNAALHSTAPEWFYYLSERQRQKFTAIQWVTTQWRAAPNGDRLGEKAFTGKEKIELNLPYFQRLDAKVETANQVGLLNVPVLLWAIGGGSDPQVNPGFGLPEDQAIKLARYMVARWQGNDVIWILPGDGDYRGEKAERWKRIGRAVFGDIAHAPVILHPGGMHWILPEFRDEKWMNILGYQSGHGDDDNTLKWIWNGPPANDWKTEPARPFINLEPPYENHIAYQSRQPISPHTMRRAVYWSLLNAPTAGVTYGGHGVWDWSNGKDEPADHSGTGVGLHWSDAVKMPGAEQMAYVTQFFTSIDFTKLTPTPEAVAVQPGKDSPKQYIAVSRNDTGDLMVAYTPEARTVSIWIDKLPKNFEATWYDPRNGGRSPVVAVVNDRAIEFATPAAGDWVLLLKSKK